MTPRAVVETAELSVSRRPADRASDWAALRRLAESYRAAGHPEKALACYRSAARHGPAAQTWRAEHAIAQLHAQVGETRLATGAWHRAIRSAPQRREPRIALARYLLEVRKPRLAVRYARGAAALPVAPRTAGQLEEDAAEWAPLRVLAVAGYFTGEREEAARACERLALGRSVPGAIARQAAHDAVYYAAPLPSAVHHPVSPRREAGWSATHPSVLRTERGYLIHLSLVDYRLTAHQRLEPRAADGSMNLRGVLLRTDRELCFRGQCELRLPAARARFASVRGVDDGRLVEIDGHPALLGIAHEHHPEGMHRASLFTLGKNGDARQLPLRAPRRGRSRNWLPFTDRAGRLCVLRDLFPLRLARVDRRNGRLLPLSVPRARRGAGWLGAAGPVALDDDRWLVLATEWVERGLRYALHRFVIYDGGWRMQALSRPFVFRARSIEVVRGACLAHGGRELLISYGVREAEAWLCRVPLAAVEALLRPAADFDRPWRPGEPL